MILEIKEDAIVLTPESELENSFVKNVLGLKTETDWASIRCSIIDRRPLPSFNQITIKKAGE